MNNFILEYYQGICNGSIVVGKWIRLLYEKVVTRIDDGTYVFDQKEANKAVTFIERFCHHNKGKLAPGRLTLSLWQKAAISIIFGVKDHDGVRQFKEVFMVIGRKCGKTLLAAAIMSYIVYADSEFGKEVYCIAPKLDQADLVYSAFKFNVDQEPSFDRLTRPRKNDLYIDKTNTTIKKIAFNEKKADGYNPYLTVADEMSSWPAERGLKQYEVMLSGTTSRESPLTLSISSAGYVNEGIFDELFKRGTTFLTGDGREEHFLPFLYTIDDVRKWDDINELRKSLPGLGTSISTKIMLNEIDVAYSSLSKKAEFLTKYCNIKQNSSQAWLGNDDVMKACGDHLTLEDFKDTYCVGGIDLSRTTDLTACCVVIEKNKELYVFEKFFLPAEKIQEAKIRDGLPYDIYIQRGLLTASGENFVDYNDCLNWFRELVEKYHIYPLQVGYDRYCAQYLVADMQQYGFHMDDVYQGTNLTPVIREFEGTLKDGRIHIGDNDLLKCHMLDSALKIDAETDRCRLVKLRKNGHIDGMAALLDAMTMRSKWCGEIGGQLSNGSD